MNLISTHSVQSSSFSFVLAVFLCLPLSMVQAETSSSTLSDERKQSLIHLLKQDCGSCHGMRLKGGLGPELTQEKMSAIGVANLMAVIKYGRPGTAMPPWQAILNDSEIQYIAEQLVAGVQ